MTLQNATCEIGNAFIQKALVQLINTKEKAAVKAQFFQESIIEKNTYLEKIGCINWFCAE